MHPGFPCAIATTAIALLVLVPAVPARAQTIPWGLTRENLIHFQPRNARQAAEQLRQLADTTPDRPITRTREPLTRNGVPGSARWRELGPPSREHHSLLLDTRRDRYIIAGGNDLHPHFAVWGAAASTPSSWSEVGGADGTPDDVPGATRLAVYDSLHDRAILLVSGHDQPVRLYELPLSTPSVWHPIAATNAPGHGSPVTAIAWDEVGQQLFAVRPMPAGVWRFDVTSAAWDSIPPPDVLPSNGWWAIPATFDSRRRALVVGGSTLVLEGTPQWVPLGAPAIPSFGTTTALLYDRAADRILAVQRSSGPGTYGDLVFGWRAGDAEWASLGPGSGSSERADGSAYAFDATRNLVLRSGGVNASYWHTRSAFEWLPLDSPSEWTNVGPWSGGARMWHSAFLDESHDRMLVYGGWLYPGVTPTVIARPLDGSATQPVLPTLGPQPPERFGQAIAYDTIRDRLLLFGGQATDGSGNYLGDLWALDFTVDPPRWDQLPELPGGPGVRRFAAMFFDEAHDRLVVFGGDNGVGYPAGVSAFEFGSAPHWRALTVSGDADGSGVGSTYFDAGRSRAWVGASSASVLRADIAADAVHFVRIPVAGGGTTPVAFVAFDPRTERCVGYETGFMGVGQTDAVWTLQLGDAPVMTRVDPVGEGPYRNRFLETTVFDSRRSRMVLYGGYDNFEHYFDDWFTLSFDQPVAVLASLLRAAVCADGVSLEWYMAGGEAPVQLERASPALAWSERARLVPDGHGRVAWIDHDVVPGARYAYRLRFARGETSAEVPVQIPESIAPLALAPVRTPTEGALAVRFTLPRAGDASIELYDVTGRRLHTRHFASLEAGEHRASLLQSGEAPAGLYWIRLASGGRTATARAVIAR